MSPWSCSFSEQDKLSSMDNYLLTIFCTCNKLKRHLFGPAVSNAYTNSVLFEGEEEDRYRLFSCAVIWSNRLYANTQCTLIGHPIQSA